MKALKKWSPIHLPVVLVAGIVIGLMIAQQINVTPSEAQGASGQKARLKLVQRKLAGSPAPPAHVQEEEQLKQQGPPASKQRTKNTKDGVLQKLRGLKTGNARPASPSPPAHVTKEEELKQKGPPASKQRKKNTREGALQKLRSLKTGKARPASPTPPAHVTEEEQLKQQGPPPGQQRQRPTKKGLLDKVRNMPGGREIIEDAKRRGARIGMAPDGSDFSLASLNPFHVADAEAQGTFSLTLDSSNKWWSSNPNGYFLAYGAMAGSGNSMNNFITLYNHGPNIIGSQTTNAYGYVRVSIPSDGWYIVNFEAYGGGPASMKHLEAGGFPEVQSWDYTGSYGTHSYPALVELAAGYHYFYFVIPSSYVKIYEVNVFNL